jgi:hypothetical protein
VILVILVASFWIHLPAQNRVKHQSSTLANHRYNTHCHCAAIATLCRSPQSANSHAQEETGGREGGDGEGQQRRGCKGKGGGAIGPCSSSALCACCPWARAYPMMSSGCCGSHNIRIGCGWGGGSQSSKSSRFQGFQILKFSGFRLESFGGCVWQIESMTRFFRAAKVRSHEIPRPEHTQTNPLSLSFPLSIYIYLSIYLYLALSAPLWLFPFFIKLSPLESLGAGASCCPLNFPRPQWS